MTQVTKQYITQLKAGGSGQDNIDFDNFLRLYQGLKQPHVNIVKINKLIFVSFKNIPSFQFKILNEKQLDKFEFLTNKTIIDIDKARINVFVFILREFWQGENWVRKLLRTFETCLPLILVNVLLINYATNQSMQTTFIAILTALSVFIAIFALFAVNQDYMDRKKVELFRNGKLAYYFSVDRNITILGIVAILTALMGVIITPSDAKHFFQAPNLEIWIGTIFLNISIFFTYILLRAIIEFYIGRPAQFVLGELKNKYLETFN